MRIMVDWGVGWAWGVRVTCGGGVSQVGHAVARALEVSLHAAAVSDCFQRA